MSTCPVRAWRRATAQGGWAAGPRNPRIVVSTMDQGTSHPLQVWYMRNYNRLRETSPRGELDFPSASPVPSRWGCGQRMWPRLFPLDTPCLSHRWAKGSSQIGRARNAHACRLPNEGLAQRGAHSATPAESDGLPPGARAARARAVLHTATTARKPPESRQS